MSDADQALISRSAALIHRGFDDYFDAFRRITDRAKSRFEQRQWDEVLHDAEERIGLYHHHLNQVEQGLRPLLADRLSDFGFWRQLRRAYWIPYLHEYHADLALIFFYSVMRRLLLDTGASVEYSDDEISGRALDRVDDAGRTPVRVYPAESITSSLIRDIVRDAGYRLPFADLGRDSHWAAEALRRDLAEQIPLNTVERVEVWAHAFYRNKAAYLVGRIRAGSVIRPLLLILTNDEDGLGIETILTHDRDISNVFTSARSNFHVAIDNYREVFAFLRTLAPTRSKSFLYSSIGFLHPAKLELVKVMRRHLSARPGCFQVAPGIPGTVMVAFHFPGFPYVFKVIRDTSAKETFQGRAHVARQYWRVHRMDRVGRMLDIMTFHNLRFPIDQFDPALLDTLLTAAPTSVQVDGDEAVLRSAYVERKIRPLNLFLTDDTVTREDRERAADDYGQAIKDLSVAGIFVGDYMTKNFGVSRTGRVILYDYDDIDDLENWTFRVLPEPPPWAELLAYEDWLSAGAFDVFPEHDFRIFTVPEPLRSRFVDRHGDLLTPTFWNQVKAELKAGRVPDFYSYPVSKRLEIRFGESQ